MDRRQNMGGMGAPILRCASIGSEYDRTMGFRGFAFLFALALVHVCEAGDQPAVEVSSGGGGPSIHDPDSSTIPPSDRERADELIALFVDKFGPLSEPVPGVEPPPLRLFPIGGRAWRDLLTVSYVDLDPGSGVLDWDCTDYVADGHAGNDTIIRTFAEQDVGVGVFAVEDGVVVAVHDGEPDRNTAASEAPANFIIIDHGFGRQGWYWHLKRNSIQVSAGETVYAGVQVAEVGSSGNSEAPHLHFELQIDGVAVEPFAGPCRPGSSLWLDQVPIRRESYLHDFGLTTEDLSVQTSWPERWPATGHIGFADPPLRVWFLGANLPAESTWKVRFRHPDGSMVPYDQAQSFGNAAAWHRFHWWWTYNVLEMHTTPGTWHVLLYINNELMVEAPIEVFEQPDPALNRPPAMVSVRFEPLEPLAGDVVGCLIDTSMTLDDPDYDVVRYEYTWSVNADIVRRVTTAGHADYLPAVAFTEQDLLTCVVTPTDGTDNANSTATAIPAKRPAVPAASGWTLAATWLLILVAATLIQRRQAIRPE